MLAFFALARGVARWREPVRTGRERTWLAAFATAASDPAAAALPPIADRHLGTFTRLWNEARAAADGRTARNLGTLLQRHGIPERLSRMLASPSVRRRLLAIAALGHLQDERAWENLEALLHDRRAGLSFAAARALLRIDPRRALETLAPALASRTDWPLSRLGSVFHELGPALVTPALVTLLVARPRDGLDRVIRLARFGHRPRIATIVRGWMSATDDPELTFAALDFVDDPSDLPWARGAAGHEDWRVRMAAARALGRVGARNELEPLLQLLRDPVWWVRYHAAHALTRLRDLEPHELETLRREANDAYASDMLGQALAELAVRL